MSRGHEVLRQLRPELQEIDVQISSSLISDIILETKNMTARIFGSPPLNIMFKEIRVDENGKPNGYCHIYVVKEHIQFIPKDKTLNWTPVEFGGMFIHGNLNGIVAVQTNTSSYGWMTAKNGILHGPCAIYGIHHLLEPVS